MSQKKSGFYFQNSFKKKAKQPNLYLKYIPDPHFTNNLLSIDRLA